MEFIDSVENCTDCGKPLVSMEAYLAETAAREDAARKAQAEQTVYTAANNPLASAAYTAAEDPAASAEYAASKEQTAREYAAADAAESPDESRHETPPTAPRIYIKRADRYEDLRSSASAFLIVGAVMTLLALLSFGSILHLPFSIPANPMLKLMFVILAAGSFVVFFRTSSEAQLIQGQISEEQEATEQLTRWFLDSYTARDIDEAVIRENGVLRPEVLALKRMNYIQDCFITHYDLVDQSYVDALSEDIYAKLYDDAEFQQTETTAQDDLADSNTDATENTDISGADTPPADAADIADTDTDTAATENAAMTDINMPAAGNTDMSDIHSDKSDSADTAVIADAHVKEEAPAAAADIAEMRTEESSKADLSAEAENISEAEAEAPDGSDKPEDTPDAEK
ncbi:MAG: hypothetical protein ACTTK0_04010 [Stomatobaculum sp.]